MGKMIEDFPRVSTEIQNIIDYFDDIEVTKYTANTDFLKVDKKSIIYNCYFSAAKADARGHYLQATLTISCAGVLDDKFFIIHGYYRNEPPLKNTRNLYLTQYQKNIPVVIPYDD